MKLTLHFTGLCTPIWLLSFAPGSDQFADPFCDAGRLKNVNVVKLLLGVQALKISKAIYARCILS